MKSLPGTKLIHLVIVVVAGVGCGGQTGSGSTGGGSGRGGRDAGRDSAAGGSTDTSSSGGAGGGAGGSSGAGAGSGGAAGTGKGGAGGGPKGGAGGATGGAGGGPKGGAGGGAQGGVSGGRCTVFQFQPGHPSNDQILVDMNGDGRLDVVSSWTDNTALHAMIYRQTAPRVFANPDQYSDTYGTFSPRRMAAADLDQDGVPDLAMPDNYGDVALMLSGGGAGYSFPTLLGLPPSVFAAPVFDVALADFDGDGYRDIAVPIDDTASSLGIYWGTGKGAFSVRADQKPCSQGASIAVADVNEDGLPDLALGCLQAGGHILVNQGGRSFKQVVLPGGTQSLGLAAGDLNHDGHVDFVMADMVLKQLIVSLGDGHGNFAVPSGSVAATGAQPATLAMGDLDGDGNADVVLTDQVQLTTIYFFKGTGDGHFQASKPFPLTTSAYNMTVGDVDGDGYQDLIVGDGPTIVYGPCP